MAVSGKLFISQPLSLVAFNSALQSVAGEQGTVCTKLGTPFLIYDKLPDRSKFISYFSVPLSFKHAQAVAIGVPWLGVKHLLAGSGHALPPVIPCHYSLSLFSVLPIINQKPL